MLNSLRAVARFFQKTIGWNRIGVLLSIAIISIAAVVLFHMLRDIDTNEVVSALKATSASRRARSGPSPTMRSLSPGTSARARATARTATSRPLRRPIMPW